MNLLQCICYIAVLGVFSFFLGRILPKSWFHYDRAPFRAFAWEKNGQIYRKLGIQHWQSRVPDMSRIAPKLMPAKAMQTTPDQPQLLRMLQETCVAETIHALLCLLGLALLRLWRGLGGRVCYLVYVVFGNLPFILIQRYNRPRLARLYRRREQWKEGKT